MSNETLDTYKFKLRGDCEIIAELSIDAPDIATAIIEARKQVKLYDGITCILHGLGVYNA